MQQISDISFKHIRACFWNFVCL